MMIRQLAILAVAVICLTSAASEKVATDAGDIEEAKEVIFDLLENRYAEDKVNPDILKKGRDWDFEAKLPTFSTEYKDVVTKFLARYKLGLLPRGQLFSIYHPQQLKEAVLVFDLFYYAPDLWTLIYTSIWASIHLNEYQFAYTLSVALVHREDTKYIYTPQPYHIYPQFFFNTGVITQIKDYKIALHKLGEHTGKNHTYVVVSNHTDSYYNTESFDPEYHLALFREDVDLNSFNYWYNLRYPFWMSSEKYPDLPVGERGEIFFYAHKTFMNRYYLERLSYGIGEVEIINWDKPIRTGYFPHLMYPNGVHFPQRHPMSSVSESKNDYLQDIKEFESRIIAAIDSGFVINENGTWESIRNKKGFNTISNMIQGNPESRNRGYYGSMDILGRYLLGFSPKSRNYHNIVPSALEQSCTSMRDPGFYRLYRKIIDQLTRFKNRLGPYTQEQLSFNGVSITSASVFPENFITYTERVDTFVEDFPYANDELVATIKVQQERLNIKDFTYKISIKSEKVTKASVRIFLGPKYDVHGKEGSDNYKHFYETDYFVVDLKQGLNNIERKSTETPWFAKDYDYPKTFKKVTENLEKIVFDQNRYGFPYRLILPSGTTKGLPVRIFFYVSKFAESTDEKSEPLLGVRDDKDLGFPLDRPIFNFSYPNMYFYDTKVYRKDETELNLTNQ